MNKPNKRQEIIEKALLLFAEKGYKGTSMREIARKTGLQPASLYSHIKSKESLLIEIQTKFIDELIGKLKKFPPGITTDEKFKMIVEASMETMASNQLAWKVIYEELYHFPESRRREIKRENDRLLKVLEGFVEEGKRDGVNAKIAVLFLLGAIHHASKWFKQKKELLSPKEIGAIFASLFCSGCIKTRQK